MPDLSNLIELKNKYGALKGFPIIKTSEVEEKKEIIIPKDEVDLNRKVDLNKPIKLILDKNLALGDEIMRTAMLRDLHKTYPKKFITDIRSGLMDVWENNPYIKSISDDDKDALKIQCNYDEAIQKCGQRGYHFIHGYSQGLSKTLSNLLKTNINIVNHSFKGDIHLSEEETQWISQVAEDKVGHEGPFWILVSGFKDDFQSKALNPNHLQEVVDYFKGKITFVQVGEESHFFPILDGTINLIGKTDIRQLIRLVYHSSGILCPITSLMHLAAAVPIKPDEDGRKWERPCVVVASGMEAPHWEQYPTHTYLNRVYTMDCCRDNGCWKSKMNERITPKNELGNMCKNRVEITWKGKKTKALEKLGESYKIGKCVDDISPLEIILAINKYISRNK